MFRTPALFVLFALGCAHAPPGPALTRNLDLEALEIAVGFDEAHSSRARRTSSAPTR